MRRWWGIRHARWLWLAWHLAHWWYHVGRWYWLTPHPADLAYLEAIWRGDA